MKTSERRFNKVPKITMHEAKEECGYSYFSDCGLTMRIESGTLENGATYDHSWVLREADGTFVDFSSYQNDIAGRYKLYLE